MRNEETSSFCIVECDVLGNKYFDDIFPSHQRGSQEDAHEMLLFLLDAIDRQQQKISRSQPGKISSIVEQVFDGKVRCECEFI